MIVNNETKDNNNFYDPTLEDPDQVNNDVHLCDEKNEEYLLSHICKNTDVLKTAVDILPEKVCWHDRYCAGIYKIARDYYKLYKKAPSIVVMNTEISQQYGQDKRASYSFVLGSIHFMITSLTMTPLGLKVKFAMLQKKPLVGTSPMLYTPKAGEFMTMNLRSGD